MSEKDEILLDWASRLAEQLGVPLDQVPVDDILGLAGVAAHRVIRPAAPLTTYIVGYAAGLAAANGGSDRPGSAMDVYADAARRLAEEVASERGAAGTDPAAGAAGSDTSGSEGPDGDRAAGHRTADDRRPGSGASRSGDAGEPAP